MDITAIYETAAMNFPNTVARVAELEAQLSAKEQELRESKARYDELRHRIKNDLQGLTQLKVIRCRCLT
jgi:cell division protein FtsB